jgi:diacylglycerol kinase
MKRLDETRPKAARRWLKGRMRSFRYAFQGIGWLLQNQPNAQIHLAVSLAVIGMGLLAGVTPTEWAVLVLCIGGVWSAEALNTALELLADHLHPQQHPSIGRLKDMAAAGVLLIALASAIAGLFIFLPYWAGWLGLGGG